MNSTFQNLQSELEKVSEQNYNLQKFNSNLTEQANKYALLLSEEKSEKKDLLTKYDTLQIEYRNAQNGAHQKIQKITKKFYFTLGASLLLLALASASFLLWLNS